LAISIANVIVGSLESYFSFHSICCQRFSVNPFFFSQQAILLAVDYFFQLLAGRFLGFFPP